MTLSGQSNRHNNPSPIWENVVDGIEQPTTEIAIDPGAAPSTTTSVLRLAGSATPWSPGTLRCCW